MGRVALVCLVMASACFVERKTDRYECSTSETCPNGRRCESGYCIVGLLDAPQAIDARFFDAPEPDAPACPPGCTSCDLAAKTCQVLCNSTNECGNVSCPVGYSCTINCITNSACGAIDCTDAASCNITCSGQNACSNITCGNGPCDVACTSTNSCDAIVCTDSCKCDVTCNPGSCGATSCPSLAPANHCTVDGTTATVCSSAHAVGCNTCP